MDNRLWSPPAAPAPYDFPPIRGAVARSAAGRALPRHVYTPSSENGFLLAAGEGLLSLASPLDRFAGPSVGEQCRGLLADTGIDMQGTGIARRQTASPLPARQASLPMPLLGPHVEPPEAGWGTPGAAASYTGYPAQTHRGGHHHGYEGGRSADAQASDPFAHLIAAARGHFGGEDARLGKITLPVARTATAFSFDWKTGEQRQQQQPPLSEAAWSDQGHHRQKHHQQTQGSMGGNGFVGGDRNLFASPSWTPELHTSLAASMVSPNFSPELTTTAWDNRGGNVHHGTSSDSDTVTSMASISPYTPESPDEQNGHSVLSEMTSAREGRGGQTMLGLPSTQPVHASQARWLDAFARVPGPIDLFATQEEKERQAEASLDIASRSTVDEELLQSLMRPVKMTPVAREPQSAPPMASLPSITTQPVPTRLAPSKTVVVPGLSLNTAPQYRRMRLADILNDSDPGENASFRRQPSKPRKRGIAQKQQSARKSRIVSLGFASTTFETAAVSNRRILPKPDASPAIMPPTSQLLPAGGLVGDAVSANSLKYLALHPFTPRTQPTIPPVKSQSRPRGGAKPHRVKSPAAAAASNHDTPLQPGRPAGFSVYTDTSHPDNRTKKRRRHEAGQTQRMRLAAQMMQEALRGVGADGASAIVPDFPQQHQTQERNGPEPVLARTEWDYDRGAPLDFLAQQHGELANTQSSSRSLPTAGSERIPGAVLGDTFDLGAVTAELPSAAVNNTVVVFCKRDFMRYQAAKLWRKYQEQQQKQEWRPVRIEGKRTRFRNPKYDLLMHKPKSRAPKARDDPPNESTKYKIEASTPAAAPVDTSGILPLASTECTS